MANESDQELELQALLELLDDMIVHQRAKCLKIARRINDRLTPDDLMNPFDWPEVAENPQFTWEDGLLAGLQSAHAAVCARFGAPGKEYEVRRLLTERAPGDQQTNNKS